jgi:vacuolar-type H+-ATPase subunit H
MSHCWDSCPDPDPLGDEFEAGKLCKEAYLLCRHQTRGNILSVNEKYIQKVLEIEKQAQEIQEEAQREAEQIPILAEDEAEELIEKARAEAEEEAHQMVESAQSKEEGAQILTEAEQGIQRLKALTMSHFDRAVNYVLDQVAGRE